MAQDTVASPPIARVKHHWGQEFQKIQLESGVNCIIQHPSQSIIAVASGQTILLYDLEGARRATVHACSGEVSTITWDPSGKYLYAAVEGLRQPGKDREGHIKKWMLQELVERGGADPMEVVADEKLAKVMEEIAHVTGGSLSNHASWSRDEVLSVLPNIKNSIKIAIDTASLERDVLLGNVFEGRFGSFSSQKFSHDGKNIYLFFGRNEVRIVSLETSQVFHTFSHPANSEGRWENNEAIMWIGESPNAKIYATVAWDHTAILWDTQTGEKLKTLSGPTGQCWIGLFGQESDWFAVGCGDGKVYVFDVESGDLKHTLEGNKDWIRTLVLSKDGTRMLVGSRDRVIEFNTITWTPIRHIRAPPLELPDKGLRRGAEVTNLSYQPSTSTHGEKVVFKTSVECFYVVGDGEGVETMVEPVNGAASRSMGYTGTGDLLVLNAGSEVWSADRDACIRCWRLF